MSTLKTGVAAAVLALSSTFVFAQQGYVGAAAGQSYTAVNGDKRDTSYKIFAGYDFNRNWGLEGAYSDLGKPTYSSGEGRETAWSLAGKGILPVSNEANLFAKLGATRNKLALGGDHSRTDALLGVGGEYNFNKKVGVRLEYEDYGKFGDSSNGRPRADAWWLGVNFKSF